MYNFEQLILCCLATLLNAELIRYLIFSIRERRAEKRFRQAIEQGKVIKCNSPEELEVIIEILKKERGNDE